MSIDVGSVLQDGLDAFLSKKAVVLAVVFLFVGVVGSIAADTFGLAVIETTVAAVSEQGETLPPDALDRIDEQRRQLDWALEVNAGAALGLLAASFLLGEFVRIGAIRALADDSTEELRREHYARNVVSIFLNRVGVAILTFVLLAVTAVVTLVVPTLVFPLLFFVGLLPFLYVAIGLYFASYAVTIDELGALDGLARAWEFAKGNRLRLALIAIAVGVVQFVIGIPTFFFLDADPTAQGLVATAQSTPGALVVTTIVGGINTVFQLAIASQTYVHLGGEDGRPDDPVRGETDQFAGETRF